MTWRASAVNIVSTAIPCSIPSGLRILRAVSLEHPESGRVVPGEQIGLIGLGLMGNALAERLWQGGFEILGWDISPERREDLRRVGGRAAGSCDEVLAACLRVVLSLPNLEVVAQVLHEGDASLRDGHLLVDTTTGSPKQAEALGKQLASRGIFYLDATVSGSSAQVRAGEVIVMAGGPREVFQRCEDLFRCFARHAFHLGPCGSGAKMKLVTNLVLGLNRAALAEGLAFAEHLQLNLQETCAILRESMAYSRIMDTKGPKMLSGDFTPQAKLSQHLKDVRLILEAATKSGARLPLTQTHKELLAAAEAAGLGELDNSAILEMFR